MDNEATTAVDSAATSSAPATTTPSHHELTNSASGTRVPPLGECLACSIRIQLAQSLNEAVCYLQYESFNFVVTLNY
jgi:hypothetical protein